MRLPVDPNISILDVAIRVGGAPLVRLAGVVSAATVAAAAPNVPMLRTTEVVPLQPTGFTPRDPAKDLPDDGNAVNGGETSAAADNCLNPVVAAAKEEPKEPEKVEEPPAKEEPEPIKEEAKPPVQDGPQD